MNLFEHTNSNAALQASTLGAKVLIVDDDRTNLLVLGSLLSKEGYTLIEAHDGVEAVQAFSNESPDIVFMDVMMPHMDGYEATRQIKAIAGNRFVPVIFITALSDEAALAKCIEAGGDDFLVKPYQKTILQSKLTAIERIRTLYLHVQQQNTDLRVLHARRNHDDEIAQRVFTDALNASSAALNGINKLIKPAAVFNGDLLLAARRPGGGLHLMLGDFTGHGLTTAIWALPVSWAFHAMTAKGFGLHDILTQINRKLYGLLPTGIFLSACMVGLDRDLRAAEIWNGGMPDVMVLDSMTGRIKVSVASRHLPLGIAAEAPGIESFERIALTPGNRILLCSDGVIEARSLEDQEFGPHRFQSAAENGPAGGAFIRVLEALENFRQGRQQNDDISLVDIPCEPSIVAAIEQPDNQSDTALAIDEDVSSVAAWHWSLELQTHALKNVDPVPIAMSQLAEFHELDNQQSRLYTVLTELYSNALHHGILRLDSAMKETGEGIERYYRLRNERLAALDAGWVRLELELIEQAPRGRLRIRIVDSGDGFDSTPYFKDERDRSGPAKRGIALVRQLCESVVYNSRGNAVEVVYTWSV